MLARLARIYLKHLPYPLRATPEIADLLRDLRRSESDLDSQVQEAIDALHKSTALVSRLEAGVSERAQQLKELTAEYERIKTLSQVSASDAEALIRQMEVTYDKGRRSDLAIGVLLNIAVALVVGLLFFLAGILFADPIKHFLTGH